MPHWITQCISEAKILWVSCVCWTATVEKVWVSGHPVTCC